MLSSEEEIKVEISNVEQKMYFLRKTIHYHKMQILNEETKLIDLKEEYESLKDKLSLVIAENYILAPTIEDLDLERFKKISIMLVRKL